MFMHSEIFSETDWAKCETEIAVSNFEDCNISKKCIKGVLELRIFKY